MYCGKCGTEYEDNAAFCPVCGEPSGVAPQAPQGGAVAKANIFSGLIGKLVIVGAVVAVLLIGFFAFRGSPKAIAKKYLKAQSFCDLNAYDSAFVGDYIKMEIEDYEDRAEDKDMDEEEYVEWMIEEYDRDFDAKTYKDYIKKNWKENREEAKDEIEDFKMEVKSVKKLKKSKLEKLKDTIDDNEEFDSIKSKNISAASVVKVKLSAEVDGDKAKRTLEVLCVVYNGRWKVLTSSIDVDYMFESNDD